MAPRGRDRDGFGRLHCSPTPMVPVRCSTSSTPRWPRACPGVQVRSKDGTDRERLATIDAVLERCRLAGATCIVNDRVDLALAAGADGVHLGADDLPVAVARRLLGADAVIGATVRDAAGARRGRA